MYLCFSAGAGDTEVDLIQVRAAIDAHQGWRTTEKVESSKLNKFLEDESELTKLFGAGGALCHTGRA
jgi:hypothetical protein